MKNLQIGKNIQMFREQMGLSQSCLASFLEMDQSYLSKIEAGERAISADSLEKLSEVFGVPLEVLEGQCEAPAPITCAFRKRELTAEDLQAVRAVNRVAMNLDFMQTLREGEAGHE